MERTFTNKLRKLPILKINLSWLLLSSILVAAPYLTFAAKKNINWSDWIKENSLPIDKYLNKLPSDLLISTLVKGKSAASPDNRLELEKSNLKVNTIKSLVSCSPISTLDCNQIQVNLPLRLNFEGNVPQSLVDKNGIGTGFTMADAYTGTRLAADGKPANTSVPGYQASKLNLSNGTLQISTNKGIAYTTNNNQINALGVKVDTKGKLVIETKILHPINGTQSQQGGIWFGLHNKTYLKLIITGNKVEMRREVNDVSGTADQRISAAIAGTIETIRLRMIIDQATNTVAGFYSTDGVTYLNVGATYKVKTLSLAGTGLTGSTAYAGIFASHRNASTSVTYNFDDFVITPNKAPIALISPVDQLITPGKTFSFSGGKYADPDAQDVLKYTATLTDGSPLPNWLKFDSNNLIFSGTAPLVRTSLQIKVTASDLEQKTVDALFKLLVNSKPTIVKPTADQIVQAGQPFRFTGGQFKDGDSDDVLSYSVVLADSSALPNWLSFDASNQTFGGTPPASGITFSIKLTATDLMQAKVSDIFTFRVNTVPTISQTPVDQVLVEGKTFSFSAGQYADADAGDLLTYKANLSDGNTLPAWLQFNSSNLTFNGTTPATEGIFVVKITATDKSMASVSASLQITVQSALTASCSPISPLPCNELGVALPFELDFTGSENGLTDINGLGTGFTMADAYSGTRLSADGAPADVNVRGHQPSKLTLINGKLELLTNKGISYLTNNNQINALGVQVNSRGVLVIETTIINPYYGTSSQQAGLWFGLDDKNLIKLAIIANKIELRKEVNDVSNATNADQRLTGAIAGLNDKTVRLKLIIDPVANIAEGFYSIDNGITFVNVGAAYSVKSLNLSNSGLTNTSGYAGIFATHRNGPAPLKYTFEEFKVQPSRDPVNANPVLVQAPVDQMFNAGQIFAFSAGEFTDPDTADVLSYVATLDDGSALPSWLKFNANNLTFSGTAPVVPDTITVKVTASDPEKAEISAVFNIVVQDTEPVVACSPISTLPCSQILESQSVRLSFDGNVPNSIADKNGSGTGFTIVNKYSGTRQAADGEPTFASVPGYEPTKITLSNGRLHLVTNKGTTLSTANNQINALGVKVDNHGKAVQIETTLVNPLNGTSGQQAGVWFGLSDKMYVQLAVIGNKVELRKEVKDATASNSTYIRTTSGISGLNTKKVYLRLIIDLATNTAEGFYSTDSSTYLNVGAIYSPKTLSILNMGLTGTPVYGGIFGTHRNAASPVTYAFEDFTLESSLRPYVSAVRPANGSSNVPLDASVSVDLVYPSGKSIDGSTVNTNTVKLYTVEVGGGMEVAGTVVNTTAAGDAITLSAPLKINTTYEFSITDQVQDGNGLKMIPFSSRFTTVGNDETYDPLTGVAFDEHTLVDTTFNSTGFTSLVIGPDHRIYAATSEGKIERWDINADGTIQNQVSINLFGIEKRLLIGFHFDPTATGTNLIAWISHSSGAFLNATPWSGKISKVDLTDPANPYIIDYVINLPRSFKDHSTNSIDFGLDNALYLTQGSNTAMGAPDAAWGNRPETLLTAAVLRLDLMKAQAFVLPINAKTEGPNGTYDPGAVNAPLTIYATGVRNAYDLVWHTNGELYVPTNGSAAGGSTPALKSGSVWSNGQVYTGPDVAAMKDIRQSMNDYLYRIEKGGYYGHPNVLRNEYILNGANPTERQDPGEITGTYNGIRYGYPVGTPTEPNYRGWAFDFGVNISPNGVIEYKSDKFGGKLKGKLLVCRFSGKDDVVVLEPGKENKDIIHATEGINIPGFRRPFANPLDIVEDLQTGNLYLSEYYDGSGEGHPRLTLLKVRETTTTVSSGARYADSTAVIRNSQLQAKKTARMEASVNIYPNPNAGLFSVALTNFSNLETVKITLQDVSGRTILTKTVVTNEQGAVVTELNSKGKLAQGMYIIQAQSTQNIGFKKMLIQ